MSSWFSMHGYAMYVWSSYGIVGAVLAGYSMYTYIYGKRVYKILKKTSGKIL